MTISARLAGFAVICTSLLFAADSNAAVTGVWRAQIEGLPGVTMTISNEGGDLTGALLFYLIRRDEGQPPRSSPGIPEPMFRMKFDGQTLDFQVSHRRAHPPRTLNDLPVSFRLKLTGPDEGVLIRGSDEKSAVRLSRDRP